MKSFESKNPQKCPNDCINKPGTFVSKALWYRIKNKQINKQKQKTKQKQKQKLDCYLIWNL